ncbi:MAG: GatB/YqeY domain-containing protein [Balneolaceae bacterium]
MTTFDQIQSDMKQAMKERDTDRLTVLRSLKAKLLEKEISVRKDGEGSLGEEEIVDVLMKAAKQRKESIEQFEQGGRNELAETEKKELTIIESYLPSMMEEEEVRALVVKRIEELGASGPQDMGRVMGVLMGELKGKAEGGLVSRVVKEQLTG